MIINTRAIAMMKHIGYHAPDISPVEIRVPVPPPLSGKHGVGEGRGEKGHLEIDDDHHGEPQRIEAELRV